LLIKTVITHLFLKTSEQHDDGRMCRQSFIF